MTETSATYFVEPPAIATELTELEQLNLKVAAIAGWEKIEIWNPHVAKRTFTGWNEKNPSLGVFVPDYTSDLNAIVTVFYAFEIPFDFTYSPACESHDDQFIAWSQLRFRQEARSPAIALCKLLLELAPNLPKPELKLTVIEATFD